jgi:uncharacterized Tic20 family protein
MSAPEITQGPAIFSDRDVQTQATLIHLSGIIGFFIVPLIVYLSQQDKRSELAEQAREALNFQITLAIMWATSVAATLLLIGLLFMPFLLLLNLIFPVIAAVSTSRGSRYRYPFALRLVS